MPYDNLTAVIGNSIPPTTPIDAPRKSFTAIVYQQQSFFTYADGEDQDNVNPEDKGLRFYMFLQLQSLINKPQFITQKSWDEVLKKVASGFVTGNYSIMPKLFIPSELLVNNGLKYDGTSNPYAAWSADGTEAFNWGSVEINGNPLSTSSWRAYGVSASPDVSFVSLDVKDDESDDNDVSISLDNPPQVGGNAPVSGTEGWNESNPLVVSGAFCIILNVKPNLPAAISNESSEEVQWFIKFEFGDVVMEMNAVGALQVSYTSGTDREQNVVTVNLASSKAAAGPPQSVQMKDAFVFIVYPVWNGIIIQNGIQESREVVSSSSTFIPMKKGRSVLGSDYSNSFNPASPAAVEVGTGTIATPTNTVVDFGTQMVVTAKNVKTSFAYLPCFFSKSMGFDEWMVTNDSDGNVDYEYFIWPVWSDNRSGASLGSTDLQNPTPPVSGPDENTSYQYAPWRLTMAKHDRLAGEIFGSILQVNETRNFNGKNPNGNFNLTWTGGTPADPSPSSWTNYIQKLTVTIGIDGSSGSITVDKLGLAGQDAKAVQSIGTITIDIASSSDGVVPGSIFKGLAMGISQTTSKGGAEWEIPLVGFEKKFEDIILINVPFFDGEKLVDAFEFLVRYAGLTPDYINYDTGVRLSVSEDVNVARFDWKSGTTVASALNDIMNDTNYNYVVMDGYVYLYKLNSYGLPENPGPDRSVGYSGLNIINDNQNPDFQDLRNQVVVACMQANPGGQGANIQGVPIYPKFYAVNNPTTPSIPWDKPMFQTLPGNLSDQDLEDIGNNFRNKTNKYSIIGRLTVPGNANIRPYDRWGNYYISSVTHVIDFVAKTWTTDLEFDSAAG